jgi:radical SAM superfamily enzyme YgiQ (UPF0313 family)
LEELEHLVVAYSPTMIRFEDETFGLKLDRTKEILRGIIDCGLNLKTKFSAQTRVDRLDDEFMALYKAANFQMLELGVESGNEEVLKRIKKNISLTQIEGAVNLARLHGVKTWCKFILGHPHETRENIRDTVNLISRLNPDQLSVSIMTPYPGTPIFDMAMKGEGGYRLLSQDWTSFDKYSGASLELEGISIVRLKMIQIWCYLRLYISNGRMKDLLSFTLKYRALALQSVSGILRQSVAQHWPQLVPRSKGHI